MDGASNGIFASFNNNEYNFGNYETKTF